jgi:hypothetical protein
MLTFCTADKKDVFGGNWKKNVFFLRVCLATVIMISSLLKDSSDGFDA